MEKRLEVRGGNSGIFLNSNVISDNGESCIRRILLRHYDVKEKIDARTEVIFALGHANEEFFERDYLTNKVEYVKEAEINEQVNENVGFVGHSDFVTQDYVYELKSATSKFSRAKYITGGTPKTANVAQLVRYMISLNKDFGKLAYTYYELENDTFVEKDFRCYLVFIETDGTIYIDGDKQEYKAQDVLAHTEVAAKYIEANEIYPHRPLTLEGTLGCRFCKFNDLCEEWAYNRFDTSEFVKRAKEIVK